MKNLLSLIFLLILFSVSKANIQDITLDDDSYKFTDSICKKYYSNDDTIIITNNFSDKELKQYKIDSISFQQVIEFLISFNRNKRIEFATKQWSVAVQLAQKLTEAFRPELVKLVKEYKIKDFSKAELNLKNYYTITLLNNDFSKYTEQELVSMNAGDAERMLYLKVDATLLQQQINFILHNSNYILIK